MRRGSFRFATTFVAGCAAASVAFAQPADSTCGRYTSPFMSATFDGGLTVEPVRSPAIMPNTIPPLTWGLAAIDDFGMLVMHADDTLWGSLNDGCTWSMLASDVNGIFRVQAGGPGVAYAWEDNGSGLYRVTNETGDRRGWNVTPLRGPVANLRGVGVDENDPLHVRAAGNPGQIYESFNGGLTWAAIGVPASNVSFLGYVTTFDPHDLDHAIYGRASDGGFVTFDGGATWDQATGLSIVAGGRVNLFSAAISPVDASVVFAMGIDLEESAAGVPGGGRHIYASVDGGRSYAPVLTQGVDDVFLSNGTPLVPNPFDANRLHLFSSSRPVFGGTRFYDYDLASNQVVSTPNPNMTRIRIIEISRVTEETILMGFDYQ